jgi:hypothetical protein
MLLRSEGKSFGVVVQHRLGQQLLQTRVLVLQSLQALRLRDFKPAILGHPLQEGASADAMPTAHIRRPLTSLLLLQNANDLLFRELAALHKSVSLTSTDSTKIWRNFQVSRHAQ